MRQVDRLRRRDRLIGQVIAMCALIRAATGPQSTDERRYARAMLCLLGSVIGMVVFGSALIYYLWVQR